MKVAWKEPDMTTETKTPQYWAQAYSGRGWSYIPVPFKTKKPILDGWQNLRLTRTDIPDYFVGQPQNIGVLLGNPSNMLVDIDLDALEALQLASHFLEPTHCRFGRPGKPDSHWLYQTNKEEPTKQFEDIEGTMLVEFRSTGAQTVFPGSVHPSGEPIRWTQFEEPLPINEVLLKATVAKLATAALLARNWPTKGSRQKAALALAGGLLRAGWVHKDVEHFIRGVGVGAGDEELSTRGRATEYTNRKIDNDEPATGWPTLSELLGDKAVDKAIRWLGVKRASSGKAEYSDDAASGRRKSQATDLVELASDVDLWHTPDMESFATVSMGMHKENLALNSKALKRWLSRQYFLNQGKAPGAQPLQDALSVLGGQALFEGREHQVYTRLADDEGKIYLDLADKEWQAVEIGPDGWRVISDPPVKFRRPNGMLPTPSPVRDGDIESLRRFVNVCDGDWPLVLAWLVAALRNVGPYPVMALSGEHGSAKSTTERVLRRLVDPNKSELRSEPKEPRDLLIAATNGLVVAFDNLSHLSPWLSDALCRLATGGGFSTRVLYENDEEMIFEAQRPVILNGINEVVTMPDLLARALTISCPVISDDDRRTEVQFWQEFEKARPAILGALLSATSHALAHVDGVTLNRLPRMADFAVWSVAAEPALALSPGTFMSAYTGNREMANELVLEASPVVIPLMKILDSESWEGPAGELLIALGSQIEDKAKELKSWPKNGRSLSSALRRLAPNLRAVGIEIDFIQSPGSRSKRIVQIRKGPEYCDARDATDAMGMNSSPDFASRVESVSSPPDIFSDAPHAPATQGVASVANIPTDSKMSSKVWQEPL